MDKLRIRVDSTERILEPEPEPKQKTPIVLISLGVIAVAAAVLLIADAKFLGEKAPPTAVVESNITSVQAQSAQRTPTVSRQQSPPQPPAAQATQQALQWRLDQSIQQHKSPPQQHSQQAQPPARPQSERQTVFNDANYSPQGAVNTMAAPQHVKQTTKRRPAHNVVYKTAPWRWTSAASSAGGRSKTAGGTFNYSVRNGRIEAVSVCKNETYGSFRYRDCRKGAKAYFTQRCKSGHREACSGASMTP